ncbi:MAG: hypothetical protein P8090_09030 [Gammaproteobacteria bacterium]
MADTCVTVKLTKTVCDRAGPAVINDKVRQRLYLDSELKGFGLVAGSTTKTFIVKRGNVRRTVDRYGVLSVEEARKKGQAARSNGDAA